ncbi:MAG TPA: toll/interleukin-1 receptor domain-containing protein [Ktedonobacteraceae bacterium]|nr:toll/interleukin-1 receptor domain-containing protein [Ktedonobacteraceae bacterium]
MPAEAVELFYVYSRKDDALRKQLDTHLSVLKREDLLRTWHDQEIVPGSLWEREISNHLNNAAIILILVSSDFIASNYCYSYEADRLDAGTC